jgi:hypothetical protein
MAIACPLALGGALIGSPVAAQPASSELAACQASGLIALSERDASIKNLIIDEEGLTVAKADTKIEDTPVKTVIIGEAYLRTDRSDKPRTFLCLIGEKGRVLLTFFTQR